MTTTPRVLGQDAGYTTCMLTNIRQANLNTSIRNIIKHPAWMGAHQQPLTFTVTPSSSSLSGQLQIICTLADHAAQHG
jgi:hypothetical protein